MMPIFFLRNAALLDVQVIEKTLVDDPEEEEGEEDSSHHREREPVKLEHSIFQSDGTERFVRLGDQNKG